MPERFSPSLQQKIEDRLRYYEDLGFRLFYKDRSADGGAAESEEATAPVALRSLSPVFEEPALPKSMPQPAPTKLAASLPPIVAPPAGPSLFEEKVADDTLLKIRETWAIARGASCTRDATS